MMEYSDMIAFNLLAPIDNTFNYQTKNKDISLWLWSNMSKSFKRRF